MVKKKLLKLSVVYLSVLFLVSIMPAKEIDIKKVVASSTENNDSSLTPQKTVDGDVKTRWSSVFSDPQWILFDLGTAQSFRVIAIHWENAYGKKYEVQVSNDAENWKTVFSEKNGNGNKDIVSIKKQKARYIRIYCLERGTNWGYSIYEVKILDEDNTPPVPPSDLSVLAGYTAVVLNWAENKEQDFYGYNIYRAENQEYKKINDSIVQKTKYIDKTVKSGTEYYYYVKAVDYFDNESKESDKKSVTLLHIEKKGTYIDKNLPVEQRVKDLLSRMTLEEKIEQLSGPVGGDAFSTAGNERLGIPVIKTSDGPWGINRGKTTAFPVPLAVASTWTPELMEKIAVAIALEAKARGRNNSLAPCLNLASDPRGGRVHEGYGEDPYLTGEMAAAYVKGVQSQNVIATPKHFVCNNKEEGRFGGPVEIDERSLRELYLPAFKACVVKGGAWSFMTAHNKVNGEYCANNKFILDDILRKEWGFKGFVMCDWGGTYDTVKSARAGLDLEMPFTKIYDKRLLDAVHDGSVSEKMIDNMAGRILRIMFLAGLFDGEEKVNPEVVACKKHVSLALETAKKGMVLLKNERNILPLDKNKIKSIAIKGPAAKLTPAGEDLGCGQVFPPYAVTPFEGIKKKIGNNITITDSVKDADVVLVFVGLHASIGGRQEGEFIDRKYLHLPGDQENIIKSIAKQNRNIVVVSIGGTAITMDKWVDSVPAVVQAWYCGMEGGTAIADVLFGDYNPGGKLPVTFPKSIDQVPAFDWNYRDDFINGVGYRYYDKKKIEPQFPFGHGLSYTKFKYDNLKINTKKNKDDHAVELSFTVKNTGKMKGDEVVQLYINDVKSIIERPVKELKKYIRITLNPGEEKNINFLLSSEDLAYHGKDMKFVVEPGEFKILIGSSSRDIRLTGNFHVK